MNFLLYHISMIESVSVCSTAPVPVLRILSSREVCLSAEKLAFKLKCCFSFSLSHPQWLLADDSGSTRWLPSSRGSSGSDSDCGSACSSPASSMGLELMRSGLPPLELCSVRRSIRGFLGLNPKLISWLSELGRFYLVDM